MESNGVSLQLGCPGLIQSKVIIKKSSLMSDPVLASPSPHSNHKCLLHHDIFPIRIVSADTEPFPGSSAHFTPLAESRCRISRFFLCRSR